MSLYPCLVFLNFTNFNFTIQLSTFSSCQNYIKDTPFFSIWHSECQDIMWRSSLLITLINLVLFASFFQFQPFMYYIFLFVLHFYSYVLHFHFLPLSFFLNHLFWQPFIYLFFIVSAFWLTCFLFLTYVLLRIYGFTYFCYVFNSFFSIDRDLNLTFLRYI